MAALPIPRANALLNTFRLNQLRLGEMIPTFGIIIGNDWRPQDVRLDSVTLVDAINDEPNTLSFRLQGAAPVVGASVAVAIGPWLPTDENKVFAGQILSAQAVYESSPANVAYDVQAIDYTWLLKKRLVSAMYTAQSASTIVQAIVQTFAPDFTANDVQSGLPVVDAISFANEDVPNALSRVMEAIGGYWYVDSWGSIHAFQYEAEQASMVTSDNPNTMVDIAQTIDLSQVSNKVYVRGGGSRATADCSPVDQGDLATIPVEDLGWYAVGGGLCEVGSQRVSYDTYHGDSGTGSVVLGDTVSVQTAPSAAPPVPAEAGRLVGQYQYKTTFVSKEGESMASPASAVATAGTIPDSSAMVIDPYSAPTVAPMPTGTTCRYMVTFVTDQGETWPSAPSAPSAPTLPPYASGGFTYYYTVNPTRVPIGPAGTKSRRLYRSDSGGPFGLTQTISNNTATTIDGDYGKPAAAPPAQATAGFGKLLVSGIAVAGSTGAVITARNLYRTKGDGSGIFYRLTTIRDNTTTTYLDNVADDNLGDEEPARGSLGTLPGSTELRVSALEAFVGHGWVYAGNQLIRYKGRNPENGPTTYGPGALTNIPASGVGSITAPLSVDTEVVIAPHLTGVRAFGFDGLQYPVTKGDEVAVLAIVEDTDSQNAMKAAVGFGDGVHELHIGDSGWNLAEIQARGRAEVTRRKDPLYSITFTTRDDSVWSGRDIYINVAAVGIAGWFKIRRVTLTQFGLSVWPLRRVEVTSQRFSFEDLLRQTRGEK